MFVTKKKISIVIPSEDNAGKSLDEERGLICATLLYIAGGYSVIDSAGGWLDLDGTKYEGPGKIVYTCVEDGPALRQITKLLPEFALILRQIVLLVTIEDILVAEVEGIRAVAHDQGEKKAA